MEQKQLTVIPYLAFPGNCEEALRVYMEAFGGEIFYLSRWSQENTSSPEQMGKVMHVGVPPGPNPDGGGRRAVERRQHGHLADDPHGLQRGGGAGRRGPGKRGSPPFSPETPSQAR